MFVGGEGNTSLCFYSMVFKLENKKIIMISGHKKYTPENINTNKQQSNPQNSLKALHETYNSEEALY